MESISSVIKIDFYSKTTQHSIKTIPSDLIKIKTKCLYKILKQMYCKLHEKHFQPYVQCKIHFMFFRMLKYGSFYTEFYDRSNFDQIRRFGTRFPIWEPFRCTCSYNIAPSQKRIKVARVVTFQMCITFTIDTHSSAQSVSSIHTANQTQLIFRISAILNGFFSLLFAVLPHKDKPFFR